MILRCYRWLILVLFAYAAGGQDPEEKEDEDTAHFNDHRGRLSWVIDDTSLPWVGSYNFLGSSISHSTVLLSVFDSSTGIKLAECSTKSILQRPSAFTAIPPLMHHETWQKVVFSLHADLLQCNVTADGEHVEPHPLKIHPLQHPRSFSVRILADKGPKCIKGLIIQNEQPNGCPPVLRRNNFSSHNFECGCPENIASQWNAQINLHGNFATPTAKSETTSAVEFPIFQLTTEDDEEDAPHNPFVTSPTLVSHRVTSTLMPSLKIHTLPHLSSSPPPTFIVTSHPCAAFSCLNNGTCTTDTNSKARCNCTAGYVGPHCETSLCDSFGCQNGGTCHLFDGQPVCQCPPHTTGPKCDQVKCESPCQNDGKCIFLNGRTICECVKGFIGGNCNVRDVCQNTTICSVFGAETRCHLEADSYGLSPNITTDAQYDCLCLNDDHDWIDCIQHHMEKQNHQIIVPSTTVQPMTTTTANESTTTIPMILLVPSTTDAQVEADGKEDSVKIELEKKENKTEAGVPFQASRKHPTNSSNQTFEKSEELSQEVETSAPEFPLTNIPDSKEISTSKVFPTSLPTETPTFSQLPDLSEIFAVTTDEPAATNEYEEEGEGDNGFEKATQIIPDSREFNRLRTSSITPPVFSTFASNTPRTYPTSSKSIEIGVDGQPVVSYPTTPDYENGVEEEIAVEETTPYEVIGPETSTHPNTVVDKAEVEFSGESVRGNPQPTRNRDSSGATTLTWIIAISAIVGILLIISGSGLFMLRYVKRSRRLHGKYNPAREENMVASTYSMPMTSVSKEERLI